MASNGQGDSEVKVYTTDTIVDRDHPEAKIIYKGLITIPGLENTDMSIDDVTEEAMARAKKLDANGIVDMKFTYSKQGYTFLGTAVRYSK